MDDHEGPEGDVGGGPPLIQDSEKGSGPEGEAASGGRRRGKWLKTIAVVVLVAALGALGGVAYTQQTVIEDLEDELVATQNDVEDVSGTASDNTDDIAALHEQIEALDDEVFGFARLLGNTGFSTDTLLSRVDDMETALDDLESTLFGFGTPFRSNVIGTIEQDIASMESCLSSMSQALSSSYQTYFYC